jgi:hypothetical protein
VPAAAAWLFQNRLWKNSTIISNQSPCSFVKAASQARATRLTYAQGGGGGKSLSCIRTIDAVHEPASASGGRSPRDVWRCAAQFGG